MALSERMRSIMLGMGVISVAALLVVAKGPVSTPSDEQSNMLLHAENNRLSPILTFQDKDTVGQLITPEKCANVKAQIGLSMTCISQFEAGLSACNPYGGTNLPLPRSLKDAKNLKAGAERQKPEACKRMKNRIRIVPVITDEP